MSKFPTDQIRQRRIESLPDWVVDHMILLSDFAGCSGLPAFETALINSMETLMVELSKNAVDLHKSVRPIRDNVVTLQLKPALPGPGRNQLVQKLNVVVLRSAD